MKKASTREWGLLNMADWVVKVGGSLLESPDLVAGLERWCGWLCQRPRPCSAPARLLLLVGGGRAADVVRQWDATHQLATRASHRLALASMSQTARLVAELTGWPLLHWPVTRPAGSLLRPAEPESAAPNQAESPAAESPAAESPLAEPLGCSQPNERRLKSWLGHPTGTGRANAFQPPLIVDLAEAAGADPELPESWEVTSDSLALWLARRSGARHLLLLKAVAPLEPSLKIAKISQLDWVDPSFARMWTVDPGLSVEVAHFHHWPQTAWIDCPVRPPVLATHPD